MSPHVLSHLHTTCKQPFTHFFLLSIFCLSFFNQETFLSLLNLSRCIFLFSSVQFSSVAQSCLTFCDPMDCRTPGFPVHHQPPELAQTHVHKVGDAIETSHPLLSPSPPALNLSQHQGLSNESTLHMSWPKYWSFSFNWVTLG